MIMPVCVSAAPGASSTLEMPKSITLAVGMARSPVRNTFSGFMSRCTTPFACAAASALQICRTMRTAGPIFILPTSVR
ncbi:hypothetical protein BE20_35450 [Sorangium cellulosum]|nr:hypothetical protein BE20_35450 [Sorangium cellulosum]